MIDSLPYENHIYSNLKKGKVKFIPSVIDYACGAGHFLISSMARTQNIINNLQEEHYNPSQKAKIFTYKNDPYSWVDRENCVGIEKTPPA